MKFSSILTLLGFSALTREVSGAAAQAPYRARFNSDVL